MIRAFLLSGIIFGCALFICGQEKIDYSPSLRHIIEGNKHRAAGQYKEAITYYEKVYEGDSLFFSDALPWKMLCYVFLEDYRSVKE